MKRKVPSLDKPYKKQRKLAPEEAELWRGEMGEKPKSSLGSGMQKQRHPERSEGSRPAREILRYAQDDVNFNSESRRERQHTQAILDLHGHTQATAYAALIRFLAAAREHRLRHVLVITGKGRGEESLRALLPRWLEASPLRESVIAYDNASPREGGEGAWVVRLRK